MARLGCSRGSEGAKRGPKNENLHILAVLTPETEKGNLGALSSPGASLLLGEVQEVDAPFAPPHRAPEEGQFRIFLLAVFIAFLHQYRIDRYIGASFDRFKSLFPRKTM